MTSLASVLLLEVLQPGMVCGVAGFRRRRSFLRMLALLVRGSVRVSSRVPLVLRLGPADGDQNDLDISV